MPVRRKKRTAQSEDNDVHLFMKTISLKEVAILIFVNAMHFGIPFTQVCHSNSNNVLIGERASDIDTTTFISRSSQLAAFIHILLNSLIKFRNSYHKLPLIKLVFHHLVHYYILPSYEQL